MNCQMYCLSLIAPVRCIFSNLYMASFDGNPPAKKSKKDRSNINAPSCVFCSETFSEKSDKGKDVAAFKNRVNIQHLQTETR